MGANGMAPEPERAEGEAMNQKGKQIKIVEKENEEKEVIDDEGLLKKIEPGGVMGWIVTGIAVGFSLFHLYTSYFGVLPALRQRAVHLTFVLVLLFLLFPTARGRLRSKLYFIDILFTLASLVAGIYIFIEYQELSGRQGIPNAFDIWFLLILESARRVVGLAMPLVAVFFILYGYFGRYFPAPFTHGGLSFEDIFAGLYTTLEGIFGPALGVSSTYIVAFVIFGAFLTQSGGSEFFFNLAQSLFGTVRGGPGKVSVLSSSLFGTVSGSAVANVMVDGWLTIPMMKRVGFKSHIAGAIEAVASTGGQIMPPVMGAAAFIMAEILAVPYYKVALAAAIPALLYYLCLFIVIDLEAAKEGISGLKRSELPRFKDVMRSEGYLLIPITLLVLLLVVFLYSPMKASFYTIIAIVLVSYFTQKNRMTPQKIFLALKEAGINTISVGSACACAGIIVGMFVLTGLGHKLSYILIEMSGQNLFLLLLLTAICNVILGMGMPTTAVYIILAALAAPALIKMGVSPMASHLFVFYFGTLSMITPPVALAAYAAASLAETAPMKTGFAAWRIGLVGFIVPFMFVYGPALILEDTIVNIILAAISAVIGVWALAISLEGYIFTVFSWWLRPIPFIAGLLLIKPGLMTDISGLIIFGLFLLYQRNLAGKTSALKVSKAENAAIGS
jgi:TRAP transporter 4TM/12TM fusion protein